MRLKGFLILLTQISRKKPFLILSVLLLGMLLLGGCGAKNQPPTATIVSPPAAARLGAQVQFKGQAEDADGKIKNAHWDFGDGTSGEGLSATHTYKDGGSYTAILTVTDDKGATAQAQVTFEVQARPKAVATVRPAARTGDAVLKVLSDEAPLTVQLDASHSSAAPQQKIVAYHWDFGDGAKSDEASPTHTYEMGGAYQATLTVTDGSGQQASDQVEIDAKALEALDETISLGGTQFHYKLFNKHIVSAAVASFSMLYWYVLDSTQRPTPDQTRAILLDIATKAMERPNLTKITAFLFDRVKLGFMTSGDYSHYLGYAIWEGPKTPQEGMSYYLNQGYFNGKSRTVLGYRLEEKDLPASTPNCPACAQQQIVLVDLYLQDETICRGAVFNTIQEIAQKRLISERDQGFLINIYAKDGGTPLAEAVGVYQMTLDRLPLGVLQRVPSHWDVTTSDLKIDFGQIPACSS